MVEITLAVIGLILAVMVAFMIPILIELRKLLSQTTAFLKNADESVNSAMKETEEAMRNIKEIAEDLGAAAQGVRDVSTEVSEFAGDIRAVREKIHGVTDRTTRNVSSIRAGVTAGLEVLLQNLISKRGGNS